MKSKNSIIKLSSFLCLSLAIIITQELLIYQFNLPFYWAPGSFARKIGECMIFALPILWFNKKQLVLPYLLLIAAYFHANSIYMVEYHDIIPLTAITELNHKGVAGSAMNMLHCSDIKFYIPIFLYSILYVAFFQKRETNIKLNIIVTIMVILGTFGVNYVAYQNKVEDRPDYYYRYSSFIGVNKFGILNYYYFQLNQFSSVSTQEAKIALDYLSSINKETPKKSKLIANHNKNIIIILVESLQSWPINLIINDENVTLNLSKLLCDSNSFYFPNMIPEIKAGHSADAQLINNTGLHPILVGATCSFYGNQSYPSLEKALKIKKYSSVNLTCDTYGSWHQNLTTINYGFDHYFPNCDNDCDKKLADKKLFDKSLQVMDTISKPFLAQIVTNSTHSPYSSEFYPKSSINIENETVNYYLHAIQNFDNQLGEFISELKEKDLFNNSIIIITGDHDALTFNEYENRSTIELSDLYIPFIVLNSPIELSTNREVKQSDIYPTLLDIMKVSDYKFRGFGTSLLNDNYSTIIEPASYRDRRISPENASQSAKDDLFKKLDCSDKLIRMKYFKE